MSSRFEATVTDYTANIVFNYVLSLKTISELHKILSTYSITVDRMDSIIASSVGYKFHWLIADS